jgi:hypothetical protein
MHEIDSYALNGSIQMVKRHNRNPRTLCDICAQTRGIEVNPVDIQSLVRQICLHSLVPLCLLLSVDDYGDDYGGRWDVFCRNP